MECEFCKKSLKNKYNLSYHKKTSKKCLMIQEKEIKVELSICTFCEKSFSEKNLKIHLFTCQKKKTFDILEKKLEEIKKEN